MITIQFYANFIKRNSFSKNMTLYMIGIGLNDEKDITVKGLEAVKRCKKAFLEAYTSALQIPVAKLEEYYGKKIIKADRNLVEKKADDILDPAKEEDVAFLVIGDVFGATTHTDLFLRAKEKEIAVRVINNTSILNAIGIIGLELYKFGKTTSIPYPEANFRPQSAYDAIKLNRASGLHTLALLDIKPDKKMKVSEAIQVLLDIESERKEKIFTEKTKLLGCARIGGDFMIKYGTAKELKKLDFGNPLHCLVIPGELHFIEEEMLENWKI